MVVTPGTLAADRPDLPSPLLLPSKRRSYSRSPPMLATSLANSAVSSSFKLDSGPSSAQSNNKPPLRKNSTGSFSALSEFHLDLSSDDESVREGGVEGVKHVELSVDASCVQTQITLISWR